MPARSVAKDEDGRAARSARTRERMLDATIDCLVAYGYTGLTTRRIAAATGLTRGAQQHHFAGKAELVTEAVVHLARRTSEEMVRSLTSQDGHEPTTEDVLDALWRMHRSPLFEAGLELWVAARTDEELRSALYDVERSLLANVQEVAPALFGSLAARPGFQHHLEDALATMRGLALRWIASPDDGAVERRWRRMRPWLAARLEEA